VSLVAVEEVASPAEAYRVWRIVTYKDAGGEGFHTSQDVTKVRRGQFWGEGSEERMTAFTLKGALINHERAVRFQQERVKNPAYRVVDVLHPTTAVDWDQAAAERYQAEHRGRA
jgi:hypothetical protein